VPEKLVFTYGRLQPFTLNVVNRPATRKTGSVGVHAAAL